MPSSKPTRRPRLRWWQLLCRAAAALVVVLAGAYATLPWWLPPEPLARRIAEDLAAQMGVGVRIERLSLSWSEGVELRGLTVMSPAGFGEGPLLVVGAVRTELSPVRLLLHRRLDYLELAGLRLDVRLDANGQTNLGPLTRMRPEIAVGRVSVRGGEAALHVPGAPRPIVLNVASLQLRTGRQQEVSMSASLRQPADTGDAPVSLSPGAAGDPAAAASAALTFSNVELAHLPAASALGLPLRRLSGRCKGSVDLRVSREGVVDAFSFDVQIRRLDVQPSADVTLPVIDEAGLHVTAAYDHLAHALRVDSASVRLPGLDLAGKAKVFSELFEGHWEAMESLELSGQVHPARLAALLTGQASLPGGLDVAGPVDVAVSAAREGAKLHLKLAGEATGAALRRGQQLLKPPGRTFRMGLAGDLDHRTGGFAVEDSYLILADNRFQGHGALVSLRRLAERLMGRRSQPAGELLLGELGRLDWRGSWEIRDSASLLELAGVPADAPGWRDVRLRGALTGRWFLHHGPATRIHVGFQAAGDTELAFGTHFVKPADAPLHLDVDAAIDPNRSALNDLTAELTIAGARLGIDRANLVLGRPASSEPDRPHAPLDLTGRFAAEQLETLLACAPGARDIRPLLGGDVGGQFSVQLGPDRQRVRISADLRGARLEVPHWLRKPAGQDAEAHVDFRGGGAGPHRTGLLACAWQSPELELTVNCFLPSRPEEPPPPASAPGDQTDWALEARIRDASRLAALSPAVTRWLGAARLGGRLTLDARGAWRADAVDVRAVCDATDLEYASAATGGRAKPAGTKLTVRLDGRAERKNDVLLAELRSARAELAGSGADLAGRAELLPDRLAPGERAWPQPGLRRLQLDANASLALDGALRELLPELDRAGARHGLSGRCSLRATAAWDGNSLRLNARMDAGDVAVADLTGRPAGGVAADANTPRKPAGLPAVAELELALPADLSRLRVHNLYARLGEVHVVAGGAVELPRDANGVPAELGRISCHLAASTEQLGSLSAIWPRLRSCRLAGRALLDVDVSDAGRAAVERATLRLGEVKARLAGKDLLLSGAVHVEKLQPPDDLRLSELPDVKDPNFPRFVEEHLPAVGRVVTDGLEVRLGRSRGWVLADVASLPDKAAGSLQVLAERIDQQELAAWLRPPMPPAPATGPTSQPWHKLTEPQVAQLRREASDLVRAARRYLGSARLEGRMSVGHLRTYDPSVRQTYDLRELELTASIADGQVVIAYSGGLNGGQVRDRYATNLADPAPTVACQTTLHNVKAEENIQPQFAKFFPRNTVHDTLSRSERTSAPLVDVLAAALDSRCPLRPVGTGKTVAIDGVMQGRAAPEFVARVFPGLNLATYHYRRMTAFAEFRADGSAYNDMVFDGRTYDLYTEGTTDADHIGRYEIGLILLGTPQSAEWNHTYRQGRIPILKFQARIEGGKMHDEQVSYFWPNETLFTIFLKNNIFYRIWLAAGRNRGR